MFNPSELLSLPAPEVKRRLVGWTESLNFKWYEPFEYFSVWNLFMFFFVPDRIAWLQQIKFQMAFQTYLVALYMTYVYPKQIKIHYLNIVANGKILQCIDFLAHQCPFYYCIFFEKRYPLETFFQFALVHAPIVFYFLFENVRHMYQVRMHDIIVLSFFYFIFMSYDYCYRISM